MNKNVTRQQIRELKRKREKEIKKVDNIFSKLTEYEMDLLNKFVNERMLRNLNEYAKDYEYQLSKTMRNNKISQKRVDLIIEETRKNSKFYKEA